MHIRMTPGQVKRFLAEALPLQDAMIVGGFTPSSGLPPTMVFLWLDITSMPELRDLSRVHKTDGDGDCVFTWTYVDEERPLQTHFCLDVDMRTPIHTFFRVAIPLQKWEQLIDLISQTGTLSFLAGPPLPWRELLQKISSAQLLQQIYEAGGDVTLTLAEETRRELRNHYERWQQHVQDMQDHLKRK